MIRYTELKVRDWQDRRRSPQLWMCPFVFVATFIKDYFFRLAFLDGARGYVVAQVAATYAVHKRLRYYELCFQPDSRHLAADLLRLHGIEP